MNLQNPYAHTACLTLAGVVLFTHAALADPAADAYRQAHAHLAAHRYAEAASLFQSATATTNSAAAAGAWLGRGEALFGAGQWDAAITAYETLLKTQPSSPLAPDALYARGFAEHRSGQLPLALATFTAFKKQYPTHARKAECTSAIERITRTLEAQAKLQSIAAVNLELAAINTSLREEKFTQARESAERFLLAHPEHPQAADLNVLAATCDYRANAYTRAADTYRTFLDRYPQHARASAARDQLADCLFQSKRYDEACGLYGEISDNASDPERKARATLALGDCHAAQQMWSEAERLYLSVEVLQGCEALRPTALARLAELYDKMGQPEKARRTREDLRRRYPN